MRRLLILLLILVGLFLIFFYFMLGSKPESIAEDGQLPLPTNSYLDTVIQKNYPNYVYLKEIGYVQKDRRAVIFQGDSTTESNHAGEIKDIEQKLESYWKWQILLGRKDLEDIYAEKRQISQSDTKSKAGSTVPEKSSEKNIFSRIFDVFKVADAVNVVIDKSQSCDCDPNFLVLAGPDLHKVKATLNPETPIIASVPKQSDFLNKKDFRSNFMKQIPNEPLSGYGKSIPTLIGIIDSGINFEEIGQTTDPTIDYNFLNHGANVADSSAGKHGTNIANIIKLNTASQAIKYVGLKTFDDQSVGNLYHNLCAILYSIKRNIKLVNASWGVSVNTSAFEEVMKRAQKANVIVVCSAGNDNVDIDVKPWFPACYADNPVFKNNIVSVTSKYGTVVCQNTSSSETKIDLSVESDSTCSYDGLEGTSFAAPYALAELLKYQASHPSFVKAAFVTSLTPDNKVKKFRK